MWPNWLLYSALAVVIFLSVTSDPDCKPPNMAGTTPGEGIHVHVFGVPIFDVAGTVLAAYLLSVATKSSFASALGVPRISMMSALAGLFLTLIIIHLGLCLDTPDTRVLKSIFGRRV